MSKDKDVVVRINGDSSDLLSEFDKIKGRTKNLERDLGNIAKKSGVTFAALTVAVGSTVKAFGDFEVALLGVGKTADLSGKELDDFGKVIQELATEMPFAVNELLNIAQTAAQLGVKGTKNLEKFTATIAKLGTASNLSGEEAATALTRILNVTNESISTIDKFASVIVALGNNFAATEREIAGITTQIARSTSIYKVSAAEAAALGATLKSLGVQAEGGGSAIGRAFREIDASIRGGGESLAELSKLTGIAGDELKVAFGTDAIGVFQKFTKGLDNIRKSGGDVTKTLGRFNLAGDEIARVLPVLAKNSDLFSQALNIAAKEVANATALEKEYAIQSQTLNAETTKLSNSLVVLAQGLGAKLAPAIKSVIVRLKDAVKWLINSNEATKTFVSTFAATVTAIAGVVFVSSGLLLILVQLRNAFILLGITATRTWAAATLGLSLIIPAIITLIEKLGGLDVVLAGIEAAFRVTGENIAISFRKAFSKVTIGVNNVIIGLRKLQVVNQEVINSILDVIPGTTAKSLQDFITTQIEANKKKNEILIESNKLLVESNKEVGRSFNEIFDEISAERAATKVREQEAAAREARAEAAILEAERKAEEEAQKRIVEEEQRILIAEQKAAAFQADLAIRAAENKLFQAQTDKASNVEITKLKQKLAALKKQRDKSISEEQKAIFKSQAEIRAAERKDEKERLEFKQKFGEDTLNAAVSLGKGLVKEGSTAQKALFLIEKASALASAVVSTARGIALALGAAPPPINFALAAAVGAAGAIQVASIAASALGLEDGGLVGPIGASRSGDRHPAMLSDGELVVPRRNFEEVVTATARQRGFTEPTEPNSGENVTQIEISLTDDAAELITARQFENTTLGIDRG